MKRAKQLGDALAAAIEATRSEILPHINDLRPAWFLLDDYVRESGASRSTAARVLNRRGFERLKCLIGQRGSGWAYRLKSR